MQLLVVAGTLLDTIYVPALDQIDLLGPYMY